MQNEFFIPQSPKESLEDMTEEEMIKNIFPSKMENVENFDEINMDKLYYINSDLPLNEVKNLSNEKDESLNEILLIDDYEAVFNKLNSNPKKQEVKQINCYNYDSNLNENYEKDDFCIPYFVKNVVSENNCFCPMKNENEEIIVKVEEFNKKERYKKDKKPKKIKNEEKSVKKRKPQDSRRIKKKRGPYKKKAKIVEKTNTEDKCFPFSSGKGVLNSPIPLMQMNFNNNTVDLSVTEDNNFEEDINCLENIDFTNEQMNSKMDIGLLKFTIKKYFIGLDGKKKRIKKKRKYKPDDIRKKIKARFHKAIKNIINENLKKAGSKEFFDFIPQCFIGNVSKNLNHKILDFTYKELLLEDFSSHLKLSNVDKIKYQRNQKVLKYLKENPEISKRAGFDLIEKMKYKELLQLYFFSNQFEKSINMLKEEKESSDYIEEYIYRAKTYIRFYQQN